ncbi:flagellar basal body P-ring formation chaperone FlgA [Musicola keenii]|uniref:flagellar basal body P-ring formation chaperone FlgA n=1 Tax=Musicola keenii TaxID=2884250 RepID=UPI00178076CB
MNKIHSKTAASSYLSFCAVAFLLFALAPIPSYASGGENVTAALKAFIQSQITVPSSEISVAIRTPLNRLSSCTAPQFALPPNKKLWGNINIRVTCDSQRYFLQADVQVIAPYVVAAKTIPTRHQIQADDIAVTRGRIDLLTTAPITTPAEAIGNVTTRMLGAGQAISAKMLRSAWAIKLGEPVQVVVSGTGFSINSEGKALENAAVNDKVRVRMDSGQIISGIAAEKGLVRIIQ